MWYWYLLGVLGSLSGIFSYSFLVVARRADERRDALEREERARPQSNVLLRGYNRVHDNSEEKVLPFPCTLPPQTRMTKIVTSGRAGRLKRREHLKVG